MQRLQLPAKVTCSNIFCPILSVIAYCGTTAERALLSQGHSAPSRRSGSSDSDQAQLLAFLRRSADQGCKEAPALALPLTRCAAAGVAPAEQQAAKAAACPSMSPQPCPEEGL